MPRWTALLFFPFAPTLAARRLRASRVACLLPLVFALGIALLLRLAGVPTDDAWASAATFARYAYGVALGGTALGLVALRVAGTQGTLREILGPACAAAAWSPLAFVGLLGLAHAAGAGAASGLYAGLLVLLWGAAAGMGIVGAEQRTEPGRLLVATCLGLSGCVLGFWLAHRAPPPVSVNVVRAPFHEREIRIGAFLLVRNDPTPIESAMVLLRQRGTNEAVFVRLGPNGTRTPMGKVSMEAETLRDWDIAGRVFFRLGSPNGWGVVRTEQTPEVSQD